MSVIPAVLQAAPERIRGGSCGFWSGPRSRRVTILVVGILLLSLLDLILTLYNLRTIGMAEANPIAAWIVEETGSAWLLSAFKACSLIVSCGLFYAFRTRRSAEFACWFSIGVLVVLAIAWHRYTVTVAAVDPLQFVHLAGDDGWISLP